jgi:DnaJ-class molecular chaperone
VGFSGELCDECKGESAILGKVCWRCGGKGIVYRRDPEVAETVSFEESGEESK